MDDSIINLVRCTPGDPIPPAIPTNPSQPRWNDTTYDDTPPQYVPPTNASPIQIFIRDCNNGKSISIDVSSLSETVMDVKIKFKAKHFYPVESQRLIFGGKQLEDGMNILLIG
jgi:hypothetical protein